MVTAETSLADPPSGVRSNTVGFGSQQSLASSMYGIIYGSCPTGS